MTLKRSAFLTLNAVIALAIGSIAVALPRTLLDDKGVQLPNEAAAVWVREVGVMIFALGAMLLLVRKHPDSPTLRALLFGNAIVHLGLLPIELVAYHQAILTRLAGVAVNSPLHLLLAIGSIAFAARIRT